MNQSMSITAAQQQKLAISGRQMQGLKLLAMSLPELRAEIAAEMSANPAIEDMDHPLETPLSEVEAKLDREREQDEPDFPEDGYEPTVGHDEEAAERLFAAVGYVERNDWGGNDPSPIQVALGQIRREKSRKEAGR